MTGKVIFEFKCGKCATVTERLFSPGTEYDTQGQIMCPKCLEKDKAEYAYLIFARPEKEK